MKKVFTTIISIILPMMASADAVEIDGLYYNLIPKAKQAEVTRNPNSYMGDVVIPATVSYEDVVYDVTSIGGGVFSGCYYLTSITIPPSITSIGGSAFFECANLTSVHISDLEAWCKIVFHVSFTGSGNPLEYADHLILNGEEITDLIIPNNIKSIENNAFRGCRGLKSVTIQNNVSSIGDYAFYGCSGINSITIPYSVIEIGNCAFAGCSGLTSVTIPNNLLTISSSTFYGCSGLVSVTIPNSVTSIGANAFMDCKGLNSVSIPHSVTTIEESAFKNCSGLTNITIPNSVTYISNSVFSGCSGLKTVSIPNSVTYIESEAFCGCRDLTILDIPNSVNFIGSSAFSNCGTLTSLTIYSKDINIQNGAFNNCKNLTDVYSYADKVFEDPGTPSQLGIPAIFASSDAFDGSYQQYITLHVPESAVEEYKTKTPWSKFGKVKTLSGEEIETSKCATPTINFEDGKIRFSCETEGVVFVSNISSTDINDYYDAELTLTYNYKVTVYATKDGFENSDVATREIVIENGQASLFGDLNKDGTVNVADHVKLSDIIMNK